MISRVLLVLFAATLVPILALDLDMTHENLITTGQFNSTYQISTLEPSEEYQESVQKLGLTPKKPVVIRDTNGHSRKVLGRFLHISDIHPDPFYKEGTSIEDLCHSGKGESSKYGDAVKGCDSPMILMNDTIKWIEDNLKDKIDFIVWTGDNVRHDNDRKHPRTEQQIFDLNQHVSDLMFEVFKSRKSDDPRAMEVDLVPSLGNNDVYPHNLFALGPTLQTRELFKIWAPYIPQLQLHIFSRGAYFFQEVIPDQLAVLLINTLYWFQLNPLVDNCDGPKEPGYKLFVWLGYVLKELRSRNMKVWLSGHVPPNEKNYDILCLRKYIVWSHEYRDVIIGGLYGHMNIDHFIPLDLKSAWKSLNKLLKPKKGKKKKGKKGKESKSTIWKDQSVFEYVKLLAGDAVADQSIPENHLNFDNAEDLTLEELYKLNGVPEGGAPAEILGGVPKNKVDYLNTLRENLYAGIKGKKKSGEHSERYSIAHVGSLIVPTFNPGMRVWEYNITDLSSSYDARTVQYASWDEFFEGVDKMMMYEESHESEVTNDIPKMVGDSKFTAFTTQSYYQTFMDIFKSKKKKKRDKTIPPIMPSDLPLGPAYTPQLFTPERYVQYYADLASINNGEKKFGYEIEYTTDDNSYAMSLLTVDEWLKFGRKLGKPVKEKYREKHSRIKDNADVHGQSKKHVCEKKCDKILSLELENLEMIWQNYLHNSFISSNYEDMNL